MDGVVVLHGAVGLNSCKLSKETFSNKQIKYNYTYNHIALHNYNYISVHNCWYPVVPC